MSRFQLLIYVLQKPRKLISVKIFLNFEAKAFQYP